LHLPVIRHALFEPDFQVVVAVRKIREVDIRRLLERRPAIRGIVVVVGDVLVSLNLLVDPIDRRVVLEVVQRDDLCPPGLEILVVADLVQKTDAARLKFVIR
jgi:hypothetical protein